MRNLKILGLALVAMLAMSAAGASVASADDLTSEVFGGINMNATNEPASPDLLVITAGNASCKEVAYDIGTVTVPTTTVTAAPTYPTLTKAGGQNCTSGGFPTTIDTNGCHYLFHVTGGTSTVGDVTLQCPVGQEITMTMAAAGTIKCTIHFPPQTLTGDPITYANIGSGTTREVTASLNAHGIIYKHTAGTGLGACAAGSAVNGTLQAKGTATANNDVNTAHVGLFLSNV